MWQSKEEKVNLLKSLVSIPSISRSEAEKEVPHFLYEECMKLSYFQQHPQFLHADELYFSALVKGTSNKTILLISHYDVVGVSDYENQKEIAFDIEKITAYYQKQQRHPKDGEWLYGRGTMDMKAGLVVEMGLLEKASLDAFDGSILLIAVGDEEVGSKGMLQATKEIERLQKEENLSIVLCVNTEPSFKEHPLDETNYLYTGSIGKLLPSFYLRGQETHVGEPFGGLNASFMAALLTSELELSSDFQEEIDGEITQVLTNLYMRDLKPFYNVQTPTSAINYFNLLFMEQSVTTITEKLHQKTKQIAEKIILQYKEKAKKAKVNPLPFTIRVLLFEELFQEVTSKLGKEKVENALHQCVTDCLTLDEREKSLKIVETLCNLSDDKTPLIVLFYSPPFYPAVSSRNNPLIVSLSSFVQEFAQREHGVIIEKRAFFQGLCDLSYVSAPKESIGSLTQNMPLLGKGYDIPFETIQGFDFPVLNLGTFGSDPHQRTERLELKYSFEVLPTLLEQLIHECFKEAN